MRLSKIFTLAAITILAASMALAQQASPDKAAVPVTSVQGPSAEQPKDISIYCEVKTVNTASSFLSVQYYDYDTDEEKDIQVVIGKDTKIENAASIAEIKVGDWVDCIYIVKDSQNIAKSVVVEKEEAPPEETAAPAE